MAGERNGHVVGLRGPTRPGPRGGQAARILGRRMEVTAEIAQWDRPRAASWKAVQGSATLVAYCGVEPEHGGRRLTYGGEGKVNGILGVLLNQRTIRSRPIKAARENSATAPRQSVPTRRIQEPDRECHGPAGTANASMKPMVVALALRKIVARRPGRVRCRARPGREGCRC